MKKESNRKGFSPEESKELRPSLHDLYFTENIDMEEELRLVEADPRLKDVTGDPDTLDKIKAKWAKMNADVEMSAELSPDISGVAEIKSPAVSNKVSKEELANLSPEARALVELGMKVKSEECDHEPKLRVVRKRSKRIFFAVAAIIVMSMAASITGVTSLYKYLQVEDKGAEEQFRYVDSEVDMVLAEVNEVEIYQQVDKFFGAPVVKLYGELVGLEFRYMNFFDEDMSVDLVYEYEGSMIYYGILGNYNKTSQMSFKEEDLISVEMIHVDDVTMKIEKYDTKKDAHYSYTVSFDYNGLHYRIDVTELLGSVMENIINILHF